MRILVLLLVLLPLAGCGQEFAVVVSSKSAIKELDEARLRDIFLKKRSFDGSTKVIPVNPIGDDPARRIFEERILMMDRNELNKYWVSNHFQGISPPTTQASLQSIKRFVESVDGAIGYLPLSMVDEGLVVLHEF